MKKLPHHLCFQEKNISLTLRSGIFNQYEVLTSSRINLYNIKSEVVTCVKNDNIFFELKFNEANFDKPS